MIGLRSSLLDRPKKDRTPNHADLFVGRPGIPHVETVGDDPRAPSKSFELRHQSGVEMRKKVGRNNGSAPEVCREQVLVTELDSVFHPRLTGVLA